MCSTGSQVPILSSSYTEYPINQNVRNPCCLCCAQNPYHSFSHRATETHLPEGVPVLEPGVGKAAVLVTVDGPGVLVSAVVTGVLPSVTDARLASREPVIS